MNNTLDQAIQNLGEQLQQVVQTAISVQDIRIERNAPVEFKGDEGGIYNKGLLWTGAGNPKQLVMLGGDDRLFSSEHIDIHKSKTYKIGNKTVLEADKLGHNVVHSNLQTVGTLTNLNVSGDLTVDGYFKYDSQSQRLGLGTVDPNGHIAVKCLEHEFVIDYDEEQNFKVGPYTTTSLNIITDDTTRISIEPTGKIAVKETTVFEKAIGIGVKNFSKDVSITTSGPVKIQNKKFEVANDIPLEGSYNKGDIVWNDNPSARGYVGWICVRSGNPGEWKPFGAISA